MKYARAGAPAVLAIGLVCPRAAFADTIDAAAQPWFVGGGIFVGALFVLFSILLIRRGLGTRRLARESVNWPVADGKILETRVRRELRNPTGRAGGSYEVFIPQARYGYAVAGEPFEGTIIRVGVDQFGYGAEAVAQAQLAPYPIGDSVPVRYNPADPAIAVLEAAEYGGARNIFGGVLLLGVGLGAFAFAAWSGTLTPT